jgi:hypothetical protein
VPSPSAWSRCRTIRRCSRTRLTPVRPGSPSRPVRRRLARRRSRWVPSLAGASRFAGSGRQRGAQRGSRTHAPGHVGPADRRASGCGRSLPTRRPRAAPGPLAPAGSPLSRVPPPRRLPSQSAGSSRSRCGERNAVRAFLPPAADGCRRIPRTGQAAQSLAPREACNSPRWNSPGRAVRNRRSATMRRFVSVPFIKSPRSGVDARQRLERDGFVESDDEGASRSQKR